MVHQPFFPMSTDRWACELSECLWPQLFASVYLSRPYGRQNRHCGISKTGKDSTLRLVSNIQDADRQRTHNVTQSRFRKALLPWKRNKYYIFVCARASASVCVCPGAWACASMQSCLSSEQIICAILWGHLWLLWFHHIFLRYLINFIIFEKKLLNTKCVFWFSLQLLSKKFLILRRIERDIVINVRRLHVKYPLFFLDFMDSCHLCWTEILKTCKAAEADSFWSNCHKTAAQSD